MGDASSTYQVSGIDEMAQLVNHRYEEWVREQQVRLCFRHFSLLNVRA